MLKPYRSHEIYDEDMNKQNDDDIAKYDALQKKQHTNILKLMKFWTKNVR